MFTKFCSVLCVASVGKHKKRQGNGCYYLGTFWLIVQIEVAQQQQKKRKQDDGGYN